MKSSLLSLFLGLVTLSSFAQLSFLDPVTVARRINPMRVTINDFDGNGFKDLAFTTERHPDLVVEYNNGDGTYSEGVTTIGKGVQGVAPLASGDLNNDGLADIAYYDYYESGSDHVVMLLSTGQAFSQTRISSDLISVAQIKIIDFDGDGNQDVLISSSTNPLQIYKGDGAGHFVLQVLPGILGNDFSLIDVNKDGLKDFITLSNTGIAVFIQSGSTIYTRHDIATQGQPLDLTTADFDGDGFTDVALVQTNGTTFKGELYYLLNDHTGNFISGVAISTPSHPFRGIDHLDYNQDSKEDIVVGTYGGNDGIVLMQNTGSNTFVNKPIDDLSTEIGYVAAADLDHDGVSELVEITLNRTLEVFALQAGDYKLAFRKIVSPEPISGKCIDLNKDGILDLITGNYGSRSISILYGKSDHTFEDPSYLETKGNTTSVDAADYNGDEFPDIIFYALNNTGSVRQFGIYLSDGTGGFLPVQELSPSGGNTVIACDLNNDSKMDIFSGQYILFGDGTGSFPTNSFIYVPSSILSQKVGDLNADGWLDLIFCDGTYVYGTTNLGAGNFSALFTITTSIIPYRISTGDFNGDNLADIVAVSYTKFSVLLNHAGGPFQEKVVSVEPESNYGSSTPLLMDFDQDGLTDIAIGQNQGVKIYLQQTDGTFQVFKYIKDVFPDFMEAVDLNGDAKLDILSYQANGDAVVFIANDLVAEPISGPSSVVASSVTDISATLSLQKGSGNGRIILMKEGSAVNTAPADGKFYTANAKFGTGDALGSSNFVVMRSDNTSVDINGLHSNTTYFVAAFEYDSNSLLIDYLQGTSVTASFTTQKTQVITPTSIETKTMGDPDFTIAFQADSGLPVTVTLVSGGATLTNGRISIQSPGPVKLLVEQSGNAEYASVQVEVTFCINPVQPAVTSVSTGPGQITLASSSDTNNHWLRNGTPIANALQKTYTPDQDGIYSVVVNYSGCTSESLPTANVIAAVHDAYSAQVQIYPNPASDLITIEVLKDKFLSLHFYNGMGQQFPVTATWTGRILSATLPPLSDGIYIVEVKTSEGSYRQKMMIRN